MKTINFFVTALLLFTVSLVSAVEKPKAIVQPINKNQFLLAIETDYASTMEVTISDSNGEIMYYKSTNKPVTSVKKIFDLKNLKNGNYSLELKSKNFISRRDLKLDQNKIQVGASVTTQIVHPYFGLVGDQLVLTHLNFEKEEYQLLIYNETDEIYKTKLDQVSPINAGYDMSKLKSGDYEVVLYSDNKIYSYVFSK